MTRQRDGDAPGTARYEDLAWAGRAELAALARGDVPWRYYLATMVRFTPPGAAPFTVVPIDSARAAAGSEEPEAAAGEQAPPGGALHVITAIQPGGEDPAGPVAARRLAILQAELRAAGHESFPATGSALDSSHAEPGFAVAGWSDEQAREWGVRFGQVAVFGLRADTWSLIACATRRRSDRAWRRG